MVWPESDVVKHSASDRLRWAQKNFAKYNLEEKVSRRLVLMLNLVVMDAMIQAGGGEALLSPETVTEWIAMYEAYRPTLPVGRPSRNSS